MNHTDLVREFHEAFQVETPSKPTIPKIGIRHLRSHLIDEENTELENAENVTEALDAIADLLYVVHGAALAYGFTAEQVDAAFREVHRSNMSKLWDNRWLSGVPEGCNAKPSAIEGWWIVTNAAGKIIKPPSYSPANLRKIAEGGGK